MVKKTATAKFWFVLISCLLFISISSVVSAAQPSSVHSVKSMKSGKIISSVQAELHYLGYYHGKINGFLDKNTRKAVKAFQEKKSLKADGIPGRKTRKALRKAYHHMKKIKAKRKETKKLKSKNLKKK